VRIIPPLEKGDQGGFGRDFGHCHVLHLLNEL
jgi:hypothetical protein